ncbi:MAG: polyprenyl synthetase family protein [Cytophagales bacterium]|nr:MAG: polyprenyl synthetase family protein [Cytophagales bacterium]TAF62362.1 MAG: polyprenyl synthetase family protein [Cytophagales bacterium]
MDANQFSIKAAQSLIKQEIADLQMGKMPAELYDPLYYIMALGGKRMRPLLTLLGSALYTPNWGKAIMPALASEVFHNFTLIHDDLMDNASLRRGQPTVHVKWDLPTAVLSGDVMLVRAYEILMQCPEKHLRILLQKFNQMAAGVCEGQQLDMIYSRMEQVSLPQYLHMIRLKTAILPAFCLEIGGILADVPAETYQKLHKIGIDLGLGFQLMDDLLDVYGEPESFGKQVGGDILENKNTFLLIKAKQIAQSYIAEELRYWLFATDYDPKAKVEAITNIYNFLNIKELTLKAIDQYFLDALSTLRSLEFANEQVIKIFEDYLSVLWQRSY